MSKERALRRAQRDQARAEHFAALERRQARAARRSAARDAVLARLPQRVRRKGHQGILARRRRAQNAFIVGLFLVSQMLVWLVTDEPRWRALAAVVALFSVPVFVTLTLDRRG